jgi:tetratricopeptide (TPR) repeat protein
MPGDFIAMHHVALLLTILMSSGVQQTLPQADRARVNVINETGPTEDPYPMARFDAGTSVGAMLENHFFPGIEFYNSGRYRSAQSDLAYVVARPHYLEGNSRRNEFMSTSHYLLGMIYMYHADGLGRRNIAREHFEKAIEWNPTNYIAYIELAKVFGELRIDKQAHAIIQRLLELKPPESIAEQARDELNKFSSTR